GGDLHPGGAGDPKFTPVQANRAVQVAGREPREERDDDDGRGESDDAAPERQVEDIERDIEGELRILRPERGPVQVFEHGLPARRGRGPAEDAEDDRNAVDGKSAQGLDDLLVTVELG